MHLTLEQLAILISSPKETEDVEFKEAKWSFDKDKLIKYCIALANEGGGKLILGVTDQLPRQVVGTSAFQNLGAIKLTLANQLRIRVDAQELAHPNGRVVVFHVPPRPIGMPLHYEGAYWMRLGESLTAMPPDMLKRIFEEAGPDFSAETCPRATLSDLQPEAITRLQAMWQRKVGDARIANLSHSQVMSDLELIIDDKLTYAALILLGNSRGLGKHLAQSELVYEYRTNDTALQFQQREEYRRGFFLFDEEIWKVINLRNDIQHFQEGLFVWDIRTFNEAVVREAILNAISHRDYRLSGSIFVRQYPRRLEIISPGGFPPGVNAENILGKHVPRNRRVAEVLAKCGLVERSGQGANRMFEECIKESKPRPDYSGTDDYQVALTLRGEVQDPRFLRFLEVVSKEQTALFSTEDLLVLDSVHRDQPLPEMLKDRARTLTRLGILERHGRGGGARYMLSHRLYGFLGKKGEYTRKRGLDKETNKELLYKHIERNKNEGSRLLELREVLPHLSAKSVQHLLGELKSEERVYTVGQTRAARWYPGKKRSIT